MRKREWKLCQIQMIYCRLLTCGRHSGRRPLSGALRRTFCVWEMPIFTLLSCVPTHKRASADLAHIRCEDEVFLRRLPLPFYLIFFLISLDSFSFGDPFIERLPHLRQHESDSLVPVSHLPIEFDKGRQAGSPGNTNVC